VRHRLVAAGQEVAAEQREQARGWDDLGLASAITAVARADADVKGAAGDAAYSLERMVLTITAAHGR
jgi:DNA polymerase-3 subunit delta